MDFISTALISMNAPAGFWPTILNWFKGANGTYILAVVLVAICVRLLFSFVDIINKRANIKNSNINAKMQPELDAIKQKYGNDQTLMQQKTNDVYKKYQYNMMGSCLPMLIMMVLQLVVFLTLWNSLQSVSNYNIVSQYQEMKEIYANVISLNENDILESLDFTNSDTITVNIITEDNVKKMKITYTYEGGTQTGVIKVDYDENTYSTEDCSNETVYELIQSYVVTEEASANVVAGDQSDLSAAIQKAAEELVAKYYSDTQEGFLWIKNVYKSDSSTSPLFTKDEIKSYMSSYYSSTELELENADDGSGAAMDYEGKIFDYVVAGIDTDALGSNGYYILPIIAILVTLLSTFLNNFLMRRKDQTQKKQSWAMYLIMPIIYAIFTFMYTSLFSIYLIVGQIMMMIISPLTTLIVRKWMEHDEQKKKDETVIEVDYRRKDK